MDAPFASSAPAPAPAPDTAAGGGLLALWHDVAPGRLAAVRDWYAREHHFERLALPGFLAASRYERVAGVGAEVFACYRVATPSVLRSGAYQARLEAPTAWTCAAMRDFRHMCRTVCAVAAEVGRAQGGHLATLASNQRAAGEAADVCARLHALPGVVRVTALTAAAGQPTARSTEQALRGGGDTQVRWAILIDADSQEAAQEALRRAGEWTGGREHVQCAVYRLAFTARN